MPDSFSQLVSQTLDKLVRSSEGLRLAPTTDELLRACVRGDQHAWSSLVERYGRLVYSIPHRAGFSAADRDDVFQSVFASLLTNIGSIRDGESLPRWLITTTNRAVWRHMERRRAQGAALEARPEPSGGEQPFHEVASLERRQRLYEGLQQLGGPCERLLTALFLEEPAPSYEMVATRLSITASSIGPTRRRCLAKLAARLAEAGVLDDFGNGASAPSERSMTMKRNDSREYGSNV